MFCFQEVFNMQNIIEKKNNTTVPSIKYYFTTPTEISSYPIWVAESEFEAMNHIREINDVIIYLNKQYNSGIIPISTFIKKTAINEK